MDRDACLTTVAEIVGNLGFLTPMGMAEPIPADQRERVIEVAYAGACQGRIVIAVGPGLSSELARNMLGIPPDEAVSEDDADEALKELANVIAGNLLPMIVGVYKASLSPPALVPPDRFPDPDTGTAICLDLAEGQIAVAVVEEGGLTTTSSGGTSGTDRLSRGGSARGMPG